MTPRIAALAQRHAETDQHLRAEMGRPSPDLALVRALKKRKLRLKDEMLSLSRQEPPLSA